MGAVSRGTATRRGGMSVGRRLHIWLLTQIGPLTVSPSDSAASLMRDAARRRPNRAVNHTGVDRHARARRRLKVHVITGEFDHHERAIGIESLRRDRRGRQIAGAQRSGCPFNEVVDALLRTYPLEYMVMAGKHDIYAVLDEQGFEHLPQIDGRTVIPSRGVQRVMEVTDLPVSIAGLP